jgi:hypothetical protein
MGPPGRRVIKDYDNQERESGEQLGKSIIRDKHNQREGKSGRSLMGEGLSGRRVAWEKGSLGEG